MIIFVQGVELCNTIAEALKCAKYHSGLPADGENKAFFMHQWISGQTKIIVATPALIQGVDYPAVRSTIFVENTYGAMGLVQGAGRGGRNGNRSDCFLVADLRITYTTIKGYDNQGMEALESFAAHGHCRAEELSHYFDGKRWKCHQIEGQLPCDTCNPADSFQHIAFEACLISLERRLGLLTWRLSTQTQGPPPVEPHPPEVARCLRRSPQLHIRRRNVLTTLPWRQQLFVNARLPREISMTTSSHWNSGIRRPSDR